MAKKAVCVLKGTGEVTGTVYFDQEVKKRSKKKKKKNVYVFFYGVCLMESSARSELARNHAHCIS